MDNFQKNLGRNPILISVNDLNNIESTNLVGVDSFKKIFETNKFSFSSELLNHTESEIIDSSDKTVFYSKVNTEFDKGDKVFILNGNYDLNKYIETNKYDIDSDGYEVLDIDNCRIVLDIKYDSTKPPYTELGATESVSIYHIKNSQDLESITFNDEIDVIYYSGDSVSFLNVFDTGTASGVYIGPTMSGIFKLNGFVWTNIDAEFESGSGTFSNKKIKIESDFDKYKKGFVYRYENNEWVVSIENMVPIITRSNFRGGEMKGSWNSGVYGRSEKIMEWSGTGEWNGGILYNSIWKSGKINSLDTGVDSFICELKNDIPVVESIGPNNNGFGYNYILSSEIQSGEVNNGNIISSKIDGSLPDNIVKDYIKNVQTNGVIKINNGLFLESDIKDVEISGSVLKNSNIKNSLVKKSISLNSYLEDSVFVESSFITDDVIKVSGIEKEDNDRFIKYRFEISEQSYNRFRIGDYFFIKSLTFKNSNEPIHFFHKKFKLSRTIETIEFKQSNNSLDSIDIKVISYLSSDGGFFINILFERNENITFPNIFDIDISNSYILDSNFESGIFDKSDWNSGFNINDTKSISKPNGSGEYNLLVNSNTKLKIKNYSGLEHNKTVFLNSIEQDSIEFTDSYIVVNSNTNVLETINGNIPIGLTGSFKTGNAWNRNGYVHKLKFKDSTIKSGFFDRIYFNNCLIENKSYLSSDKDFKNDLNIRSLLISRSIFSQPNNLSSATYVNCFFNSNRFNFIDGIVYKSIWDGGTFNKGVFKESTWISGIFNSGEFYKNRSFNSNPSFEIPEITDNRIDSFYKSGEFPNDRYSWQSGTFSGGLFNKSDWEDGVFKDGKFIDSNFYSGTFSGGVIGDKSVDYNKTRIYNGTVENVKVENAELFTEDASFSGTDAKQILWKNGIFEKGVFGSKNVIKEKCYTIGSPKSTNVDYIFISDKNNSYRYNDDGLGLNLTYSGSNITDCLLSIKSLSDSVGNLIHLYKTTTNTYKVVKYGKNGNTTVNTTNSREENIEIKDIFIDRFDNLYICFINKIEKWSFNFKLIWSNNNNVGNLSISGDDEFIYVGGENNSGYIEKWTIGGIFVSRTDLTNYVSTSNQKIIPYSGFVLINGLKTIYKIRQIDMFLEDTYTSGNDIIDYTYDYINEKIILTSGSDLQFLDINKIDGTSSHNYVYSKIEYYNGFVYGLYNNVMTKLKSDLSSIYIINLPIGDYSEFVIKPNGIKYSELELIGPTYSNGDLVDGIYTFDIENSSSINLEIDDIEFPVGGISFNYSVREKGRYDNSESFTGITFSVNIGDYSFTQSVIVDEYLIGGKYIYSTDWLRFEQNIPIQNIPTDNNLICVLTFSDLDSGIDGYRVKVDNFCVYSKTGTMSAIWENGTFNGGEFIESAQWKNGTFNGGLFLSKLGNDLITSTQSPTQSEYFGWINGKFNGGEFGNGSIVDNSIWYDGEFNGGTFKGKFWNNGVFNNGTFEGGIDINILGNETTTYLESVYDKNDDVIDYSSTRGVWKNGYVATKKDKYIKDKKIYTDLRKISTDNLTARFENVLWVSGTFSHDGGYMKNSIWLDGTFESGTFESSVFNPWFRNKFNEEDTCIWLDGLFKGGDFYYSKWKNGLFNTGNAYGMIWEEGVSNYMNAYNILWKKGVWKNGNWFGSNFRYRGFSDPLSDFETTIIDRVRTTTIMDDIGTNSYNIWNVFDNKISSSEVIVSVNTSNDNTIM